MKGVRERELLGRETFRGSASATSCACCSAEWKFAFEEREGCSWGERSPEAGRGSAPGHDVGERGLGGNTNVSPTTPLWKVV